MHTHSEATSTSTVQRPHNPLGVKSIDHIEFFVDNVDKWADYYANCYGLYRRAYGDPSTGLKGRKAVVVGQGRINFLFAEAAGDGEEAEFIRAFVAKHGSGVRDVAFRVRDTAVALTHAASQGAKI